MATPVQQFRHWMQKNGYGYLDDQIDDSQRLYDAVCQLCDLVGAPHPNLDDSIHVSLEHLKVEIEQRCEKRFPNSEGPVTPSV